MGYDRQAAFDVSHLREFTVEAGRPDSITREKLQVLLDHGIDRISINPQTMKDETLRIIGRHHTVEQTKEYLQGVFESAVDLREAVSQKKYSSLLKDARAYIERNYDQEDISLNKAAASVNLSPNHFSTIFNQETGQTFIEFLTEVRMERAKELLRTTDKRSGEVAAAVGYKDPHYFSFLFKKTQGCTPRDYRGGGKRS